MTQTNPPPPGPSSATGTRGAETAGARTGGEGRGRRDARRRDLLRLLGLADLDAVAERCAAHRRRLGLPAGLWTPDRLTDVLADAVLDRGLPAATAVMALLAVAADPATRSPARAVCPGPWWDQPNAPDPAAPGADDQHADQADLAELEAVLAELDGRRVVVHRQARAQLAAEGLPPTRRSVARRAVDLALEQATQTAEPPRRPRPSDAARSGERPPQARVASSAPCG